MKKGNDLQGDFAEVGVYRGSSAMIASLVAEDKTVHLFDTFEGLPDKVHDVDCHAAGEFSASLENVREYFKDRDNVMFYKGVFPQDTSHNIELNKFCFVHLDVDLYIPTFECLAFFYDRLVSGGKIISDDFNWPHTPGVNKAINEFLVDKPEQVQVLGPYGHQALIIKQ